MFNKRFLLAGLERALRAGAAAVLSLWVVGDGVLNAWDVDWQQALGVFLGAAVVSALLSLVGAAAPGNGPSLIDAERLAP
jgi:hypothetical protein